MSNVVSLVSGKDFDWRDQLRARIDEDAVPSALLIIHDPDAQALDLSCMGMTLIDALGLLEIAKARLLEDYG